MKRLTNIEKSQLIKLVIGDLLFPLDFEFKDFQSNASPGTYYFLKKENDVTQEIEIQAKRLEPFYNIRIRTSVCWEVKYLTDLILEQPELSLCKPPQSNMWGWSYSNRDELLSLLKQFCILIPIYILPELEKMSVINDPFHIRTEIFDYMRKSVETKEEQQKEKGVTNDGNISPDAIIDNLSMEIHNIKKEPYPSIEKKLADLAVRYGEMLIEKFGGKWKWVERTNSIVVSELSGKRVRTFPLKLMISVWKGEETLQADYQRICSEIPNASECLKVNKKMNWIRHKLGLDWDD